jgi:hypothetical protein
MFALTFENIPPYTHTVRELHTYSSITGALGNGEIFTLPSFPLYAYEGPDSASLAQFQIQQLASAPVLAFCQ